MRSMADRKWVDADAAYDKADKVALDAVKAALTPGRVVRWQHGDRWRSAVVMEVSAFQYHGVRVRVKSIVSGKEYDVDAYSIRVALPP